MMLIRRGHRNILYYIQGIAKPLSIDSDIGNIKCFMSQSTIKSTRISNLSTLKTSNSGSGDISSPLTMLRVQQFATSAMCSKSQSETKIIDEDENNHGMSADKSHSQSDDDAGNEVEFTLQLSDEEIQELSGGDPEIIKKIRFIQLEHEVYRQEGMRVPLKIKVSKWKDLLEYPSSSGRRKFYNYLWLNETKQGNRKQKKEIERIQRIENLKENFGPFIPKEEDPYGMTYGLGRNSIQLRVYDSTINKFYHNRLVNAMMFSRPLVLDLSYDEFMTPKEAKNCAKQLELLISENRIHKQPFDLHFCNADPNYKIVKQLSSIIPTLYEDHFPLHITEKSYLDIFPHKELVYLTPHARDELEEFKEDEIYIVGAMVDKSDPRPFSLAKAKREKLKMKKLPLDKYLVWGLGNKSLTLNQMALIMLDLRLTGDWKQSLQHVPMRKLNRDYHPYPNQINGESDNNETMTGRNSDTSHFSRRRESKSQVLEDFDLINQRKGFRRFDAGARSFQSNEYTRRPDKRDNFKGGNLRNIRRIFDE